MPNARGRASALGVHRLSRAMEPPARGLHPSSLASSPCVRPPAMSLVALGASGALIPLQRRARAGRDRSRVTVSSLSLKPDDFFYNKDVKISPAWKRGGRLQLTAQPAGIPSARCSPSLSQCSCTHLSRPLSPP